MNISTPNGQLYAYIGGKEFDAAKPTVVFIHGVLNDHSVWILQSRYLAHHGWNVLAIDLPGHGKSGGEPPATVEAASATIVALLDALGVAQAALVGHSFGSLIALETAARAPARSGYACPTRPPPCAPSNANLLPASSAARAKAARSARNP